MAPRNNLALPFGRIKALLIAGFSNDSNDVSTRDIYLRLNMITQINDCARYERVFRLKIYVASTRPVVGRGEKNLLRCDPEYELRLSRGRAGLITIPYLVCYIFQF